MTEQTLLRLAMVLQDQAPTTLNKYICKLAEIVLLDYPDGINVFQLNRILNEQFNLSFTDEEIRTAILKKGQNKIITSQTLYKLAPDEQAKLVKQQSLSEKLKLTINEFITCLSIDVSDEQVYSLLLRYLYFCFNSNVDNLLSLFERKSSSDTTSFSASAEEISIINRFIEWDNSSKNALVYSLIATCYEYCMLTIKKDNILSSELFKGKRFYLDANIIFRMAGINNKERQTVTQRFADRCREVGIELYCTSATMDEIYRVISSQIEFIKNIAGGSMPVSNSILNELNPNIVINDFYNIYYNWCTTAGNTYGDYDSFTHYLLGLIRDTLSQFKIKDSSSYKLTNQEREFNARVVRLIKFKNDKRSWRDTSLSSAETDITNIMDTISWRAGTGCTMWQTNDFIVSADRLLIGWTEDCFTGVPIVVLPSVWLSIILRFTGRTDDDYKSFCLFLTQRQHINPEEIIDPIHLLRTINTKTNQIELKEKIIYEITQNKTEYSFQTPEDYDASTERAFDKVLNEVYGKTAQEISAAKAEMQQQIDALTKNSEDTISEREKISAATAREKTIIALSKNKAEDKVKLFRNISNYGWLLYVLAGLVVFFFLVSWSFELPKIYDWMNSILPDKIIQNFMSVWAIFTVSIGLVSLGVKKLIAFLGSEKREKKLYEKYYKENLSALNERN